MGEEDKTIESTEEEWKEKARLWGKRARSDKKRADEAESNLADLQGRLEKATARAEAAQAEVDKARSEREHADLVAKVADRHGIGQKYRVLLTGPDEEALEMQAQLLAERFADPVPSDDGKNKRFAPAEDEMKKFARELFGRN